MPCLWLSFLDLNETFLVGAVDDEGVRVVRCAFDCLANALAAVRPGVMYRELGQLITDTASSYGFQVVYRRAVLCVIIYVAVYTQLICW